MTYLFIDESGDLGFSTKGSEYFIITCVKVDDKTYFDLKRIIKTEFLSVFKDIPKINITHENSQYNECLQVIDYVCGAFGYKYNTANLKGDFERYTNIIKDKIIIEKNDLFRK